MNKKRVSTLLLLPAVALSLIPAGCGMFSANGAEPEANAAATAQPASVVEVAPVEPLSPIATEAPAAPPDGTDTRMTVQMSAYTEAPNADSSVQIRYPVFSGGGADAVNAMVMERVRQLAQFDTSLFPADAALTAAFNAAVTLLNSRMASIVLWGSRYVEGGMHPTTELVALNIDLQSMQEVPFAALYASGEAFERVFFASAYFPTDPVTSYDAALFAEMLQMQSPEFQMVSPFADPQSVTCFLKPDGVVLSMSAIHATGSDHFEAQLSYDDVSQFYLPAVRYWEDA